MTPLTLASEGCNALDINPAHNLFTFGLEDGTVEFWDPRAKDRLATLQLESACTALGSRSDGLSLAVGTQNGFALVYDLRSTRPLARKDQGYGLPVHRISWLERAPGAGSGALVASADKKVLKIWDRDAPATNFAAVTPETDINDVHHLPGTGMMLTANEGMPMHAYYVPSLGPAPRWCSFLDSLTEELEEGAQATRGQYEDFKFLDRAELERLGLDTLIGTPALRPYMHGFFVKLALYDAARVIANPYVYEEARAKAVQEKVDKLADSRIRAKKGNQPKVNAALAERVRKDEERATKKRKRNAVEPEVEDAAADEVAGHAKTSLLADPRFKAVFENPDFAVDEANREWQLLNPSSTAVRDHWERLSLSDSTPQQKRRRLAGGDVSESSEDEDDEEDEVDAPRSGLFDTDSEPSGSAGESDDEDATGGAYITSSPKPFILNRSQNQNNRRRGNAPFRLHRFVDPSSCLCKLTAVAPAAHAPTGMPISVKDAPNPTQKASSVTSRPAWVKGPSLSPAARMGRAISLGLRVRHRRKSISTLRCYQIQRRAMRGRRASRRGRGLALGWSVVDKRKMLVHC